MALKKVKTESSRGRSKERWVTRTECKTGARKRRRRLSRAICSESL
jgi:hypothetical protein